MSGFGFGFGLGRQGGGVLSPYSPEAAAYFSRVAKGGGSIVNVAKTAELIDYLVTNSLYSNLLFGVSEIAGMTTRVDEDTTYITKLYDISASGKDATQETSTKQPILNATGILYDGNDDFLAAAPIITGLTSYTILAWLKIVSTTGERHPFGFSPFQIYGLNAAGIIFSATGIAIATQLPASAWTMMSIVASNGVGTTVNNTANPSSNTDTDVVSPTADSLNIGTRITGASVAWDGYIGGFLVFNKALSGAEITGVTNAMAWRYA